MSTSTSPRSEQRTVLLWGDRWWLDGESAPVAFAGTADAAEALAGHLAVRGAPARVRLVYQPDTLTSAHVNCPKGGRSILAAALAGEFSAVDSPNHAWSHEPVLPDPGGFSTWLHFEREPILFELVAKLRERGIAVNSAWPLPAFLHALPADWSDSGAITVLAIEEARACAYRHPRDGVRSIRTWRGAGTRGEVRDWLREILSREPDEPVLVVAAAPLAIDVMESPAGTGLRLLAMADVLAQPVVLPSRHPAQLLPPAPVLTAQRAVIAAGIALVAAAGWLGAAHARDVIAARETGERREERKVALRAEVAHLRANDAEIAALRAGLPKPGPAAPVAPWLQRLSESLPSEIALSSLRITAEGVTVTGFTAPGSARGLLAAWKSRITSAAADPLLHTTEQSATGDRFTLAGRFAK